MSSGLRLVDFAIGLMNYLLNFLDEHMKFFGEGKLRGDRINEGFFTRKCIVVFAERPKKSGCNNKVTVLPRWLLGEVPLYPSKGITELLNNYDILSVYIPQTA